MAASPTYVFQAVNDPNLKAGMLAGETGAIVTGGVTQNIEQINRPGRDALTIHTGSDPLTMDVPILIEGFEKNEWVYVEEVIRVLQKMAGFNPDGDRKPYRVKLLSAGKLNPFPNKIWWITGLTYGEHIYNGDAYRVRQEMTVQVTEFITDNALDAKSLKQLIKKKAPLHVKAKKGETLRKVIRRIYQKANTREIRAYIIKAKKLNDIKDADKKFTQARELILPPRGSIDLPPKK